MSTIFSNNLKKLRREKNFTQEQVAEKLGVTAQTVSRWECGTTFPDVMLLPEIARLYCVTIDDLYKESSVAYANYAQRLASIYEASQKPEDFMQAEYEFRKLFQTKDYDADDLMTYGVIHHFMLNYCKKKALTIFDEIIDTKANGDMETYYRTRGQKLALFSDIGKNSESIRTQQEIIKNGSTDWQEYGLLIDAYLHAKDYQAAYDCFQSIISKFPEEWALYVYGGDICRKLEQYNEAFQHWNKALELNPKYLDAKYSKALTYEELGKYEKAYDIWQEILTDLQTSGHDIEAQTEQKRAEECRRKLAEQ